MKYAKRKPKRSIRNILIWWFLILSILPLIFIAYYSTLKYEQAIDKELLQRLSVNSREVNVILSDFKSGLQTKRDKIIKDPYLLYSVSTGDQTNLDSFSEGVIQQDFTTEILFFNRNASLISRVYKDEKNDIYKDILKEEVIILADKYVNFLKENKEIGVIEYKDKKIYLGLISKITNQNQKTVGYIEQLIVLDQIFLNRLKARLKLDFFLAKEDGTPIISTFKEFEKLNNSIINETLYLKKDPIFEIKIKNTPFGFFLSGMDWGHSKFFLGIGVSKSDSREVLKNINFAFYSVVAMVMVFLFITVLVTSNWVLKPLYELVEALQSFENQEQAITIPVKNDTEIGLLTESFNHMSSKIWQARSDLQKKVKELEDANKELKETQKRLVHSAKMISLGELVAGVAHELNNPISFIYSNMTHLKEYSEKLIDLIQLAENKPSQLNEKKEEYEFDFIVDDMPKLINSCQDGARRTRDIVLGLRNFSRIDEAQVKEVDLRETMDTTLNLLQGEIKNRIEVKKDYESIALIKCYASQLSQVFMNLLSNAIQAIENTGTIWITIHNIKIERENFLEISIQDTGKGISPENLDKIFDPFFTTKGVGQGTGLGLSITYGIIQKHGGDIQVKSQLGVGTEFKIIIPINSKL